VLFNLFILKANEIEKREGWLFAPNKALKLARVARWTPSTGAASQYRAGFSRRLALR
jgi:hypothetical protein